MQYIITHPSIGFCISLLFNTKVSSNTAVTDSIVIEVINVFCLFNLTVHGLFINVKMKTNFPSSYHLFISSMII